MKSSHVINSGFRDQSRDLFKYCFNLSIIVVNYIIRVSEDRLS